MMGGVSQPCIQLPHHMSSILIKNKPTKRAFNCNDSKYSLIFFPFNYFSQVLKNTPI